ncbi:MULTISPECIES: transglutaminase N-terminal domain-containing protein [unclassified Sphingomonas]|uniref:transglutaminase family protein n=1 Tax=unclassified Sphingomonas TaxID=196159 RepID=UPI002151A598|nr:MULTISPECIES: transglutaminase N-terminal domain-containing protein [unclassified Sphingomonas]MCR5872636.1 transglutaminase family protein [Sphingomonas sp. J344]UUX99082.1 transglutaminase family protein [Sphingomonas sp. J315]
MRLAIDHHTRYRFSTPQQRLVQTLRLTPGDTHDQTVVDWRIDVDCDVRLRDAIDGFGNHVTMLYAEGPIAEIAINVAGQVLTVEAEGVVRGSNEPLPPQLFQRTTQRTTPNAELAALARDAAAGGAALDQLHRWNLALAERFPEAKDLPDTGASAAEALLAEPNARDLAHIFIAGAVSLGLPARYVSGYRQCGEGTCPAHGWAEAWVEGLGWVGFDPSAGISPDANYVRMATALDFNGAAPVAGIRQGAGIEDLSVELQVEAMNGDA